MAQQPTPLHSTIGSIGFKNIQLFKEKILGIGSYGKVCGAKCDNLLCAAKIIHETLYDQTTEKQTPRRLKHRLPMRRFEQECEFLNTIRHPNVIQYLGVYQDPDTGLLVLLMELMDESLTHFLESATQSVPHHIQINICHDISLALTFLHANGIIHRDLSSNNVLLIGSVRAKVTDFGMAKLGDLNPQMSRHIFTMCPGTDAYMPPEAVQDQPTYTMKIDCFSFGVIIIQVLSRQFPKPGDRMQTVEISHPGLPRGTVMVRIPEVDRRQNHISQINPDNILLPIAIDCLKDKDVERPSAQQLSERLANLKKSDRYSESVRLNQATISQMEMQEQRKEHMREIQQFQESQAREQESLREKHTLEIQHLQELQAREQQSLREENAREIQERKRIVAAYKQKIQDLHHSHNKTIIAKEKENQQLRLQLKQAELRMKTKEQTIEKLEGQLKQMQLDLLSKDLPQPRARIDLQAYADMKLKWRLGTPAPQNMSRWCNAVTDETMVYFNVSGQTVYGYNMRNNVWTCLPDCPNWSSSFVVINNMLAAIGGIKGGKYSNKVYILKRGEAWVEELPPMPTERTSATAVCTESALIVVGGVVDGSVRCPVEVMSTATHQWSTAADISTKEEFQHASGVICGDQLYVLGAINSKSVYSCSLSDLLQSCQSASDSETAPPVVWTELTNLPLFNSTCVSLCGHLIAIGGNSSTSPKSNSAKAVYAYTPTTNSWEVISQMSVARRLCFAVVLPINELMVAGGINDSSGISSVEFANMTL